MTRSPATSSRYRSEPNRPTQLHPLEPSGAEPPQLLGRVLDEVVRIDDLVGAREGQPVGSDEDRRPFGPEDPAHLREHSLGIRDVLDRLH